MEWLVVGFVVAACAVWLGLRVRRALPSGADAPAGKPGCSGCGEVDCAARDLVRGGATGPRR